MYVENFEMHNSLKWVLFIKESGQITSDTLAMEGNLAINSNTCQMLAFYRFFMPNVLGYLQSNIDQATSNCKSHIERSSRH